MSEVDPWTRGPIRPGLLRNLIIPSSRVEKEKSSVLTNRDKALIHARLIELGFIRLGQELQFTFPPKRHPGSGSEYSFEGFIGKNETDEVYIAKLGRGRQTTTHRHPFPIREPYYVEAGRLGLVRDGKFTEVKAGEMVTIERGVVHQAGVDEEWEEDALLLLIMRNASFFPKDKRHIPVPENYFDHGRFIG